jgi:hypothetical protein
MKVLIDTCIIIDMVDRNQERAAIGSELYKFLISMKIDIVLLRHSFFEMAAVLKNLKENNKPYNFDNDFKLNVSRVVDINEEFVNTYLDVNLPYSKGADCIFLCYSFKEQIEFITEDVQLYKKCKNAGTLVYSMKEYLSKYKT